MTTADSYRRREYEFGPRETGGILLGLGMGSILTLFGGMFLLVRLLVYGWWGLSAGLVVMAAAVAAVWVPIGDRALGEWARVGVMYGIRARLGWTQYRGGPAADTSRTPPEPAHDGLEPLELPGELAGIAVLSVATPAGTVGVIKDRRRHSYTAIIATRGTAFQLLTVQDQDQRLAMWGELLSSIAYSGGGIVRLQVIDTTVPDSGDRLVRQWAAHGGGGTQASAASYEQLLDLARPVTLRHETHLAVMLDPRRVRRQIRHLGGGDEGACTYLLQRCAQIEEALANTGVTAEGALPPRAIHKLLRSAYEPGARWKLDTRGTDYSAEGAGGASAAEAGPMAAHATWPYYRTDDTYHAIFWVSEWPRKRVFGDFLQGLILETRCTRTVSVVMQPLNPRRAADEVARADTAKGANEAVAARYGFRRSARDRRESATLTRQDEELASGHALYRFIGLVRISAATPELLDQACGEIETRATMLQLRRLYGEQDVAFPATLPLCRGLRWGLLRDAAS
ncbi:hypothetical protein GCM10010411_76040 [Actinomadura fulvescens]|uniref:PrgI family protein n=1 Tax=Actinomadura fulvescens TaxID=46160 RepID=A0ABN3QKD2_9ACTN